MVALVNAKPPFRNAAGGRLVGVPAAGGQSVKSTVPPNCNAGGCVQVNHPSRWREISGRKGARACRSNTDELVKVNRRLTASYCRPPTVSPCFYGVDTPSKRELIAANKSIEEIRQFIEADSLAYLSLDGLLKCCDGEEHTGYCTACYTGNYPTQWVDVEEILPATVGM